MSWSQMHENTLNASVAINCPSEMSYSELECVWSATTRKRSFEGTLTLVGGSNPSNLMILHHQHTSKRQDWEEASVKKETFPMLMTHATGSVEAS